MRTRHMFIFLIQKRAIETIHCSFFVGEIPSTSINTRDEYHTFINLV